MNDTPATARLAELAARAMVPDSIVIDLVDQKLYVDGVLFPFVLAEEPEQADYDPKQGHLPSVLVRIYAGSVQVRNTAKRDSRG